MKGVGQDITREEFLALSYRDRQLITVVDNTSQSLETVEVRLVDYLGAEANPGFRNLGDLLTLDYWKNSKSWGVYGYLFDKARGNKASPGNGSRDTLPPAQRQVKYLRRIPIDLAEELISFKPPHPLYDMAYAAHPFRRDVYIPVASFHHELFEDKLLELLTLLWSLGAHRLAIQYLRGYKDSFEGSAGLKLPAAGLPDLDLSVKHRNSAHSEATLEASFKPAGAPHIPEGLVWYEEEGTWKKIAEARLSAGMTSFDLEINSNTDFGISGEVAAGLQQCGIRLGGDYQQHERTSWKVSGSFEPMSSSP